MAMDLTKCTALKTLTRELSTSCNTANSKCKVWCDADCELTTNLSGDQITEMIVIITAAIDDLIVKYTALKDAWDGY